MIADNLEGLATSFRWDFADGERFDISLGDGAFEKYLRAWLSSRDVKSCWRKQTSRRMNERT